MTLPMFERVQRSGVLEARSLKFRALETLGVVSEIDGTALAYPIRFILLFDISCRHTSPVMSGEQASSCSKGHQAPCNLSILAFTSVPGWFRRGSDSSLSPIETGSSGQPNS